ncbi:MAG: AhpD family alkylhydroperoxidase [Parvicellaceae bacterium]|jgi:AhpD family alkylhydroperoxidase
MSKDYPKHYHELRSLMGEIGTKIPNTMKGFSELHKASLSEGALTVKTKELIALSIAISVRCDGCIAYHVHDSIKAGATSKEIEETIGVAIMMGGGPSLVYGCEAMEALKQFEALEQPV